MKKTLLIAGALATLLAGCATTYHPDSFTGGYSESRLGPNVALVSFRGNGFSSQQELAGFSQIYDASYMQTSLATTNS